MTPAGVFWFLAIMVAGLYAVDASLTVYLRWCDKRAADAEAAADALDRWQR